MMFKEIIDDGEYSTSSAFYFASDCKNLSYIVNTPSELCNFAKNYVVNMLYTEVFIYYYYFPYFT